MLAAAATSSFFPVPKTASSGGLKVKANAQAPPKIDGSSVSLDTANNNNIPISTMLAAAATSSFFPVPKTASSGGLKVKANAQAPPKIDGSSVSLDTAVETVKIPDWSMLLGAINSVFSAAEKEWMMPDCKERRADMLADTGKSMLDGFVFKQRFFIRSYDIGADRTASMETLMKKLQETALNHCMAVGLLADGFGSTPEMCKANLIWVVSQMQVLVDYYPTWGDVVEVHTWATVSGKHGMRRDWLLHDAKTGQTMAKASSVCALMNKVTRKMARIPESVRAEIEPYFLNSEAVVGVDRRKIEVEKDKEGTHTYTDLRATWSDLDMTQHVNNVKYVRWILDCVLLDILESHELASMTLKYRRECEKDSVMDCHTAVSGAAIGTGEIECQHFLQFNKGGPEIMRARTDWRPNRPRPRA